MALSLAIGEVVGGYTIIGLVPNTRRGKNPVYLGAQGDQHVALKFIFIQPGLQSRVENEIMMQHSLRHEYIIEYLGDFSYDPYHCLVLEFAPSGSVFGYMKTKHLSGGMDEYHAKIILSQLLDALRYMHSSGYVHGDIKPHNFMLMNGDMCQPVAKLADFGTTRKNDWVPITDVYPGTLQFRAPEIIRTDPQGWTNKADMWSFGIAMHYMLTGKLPPGVDGKRRLRTDPVLHAPLWGDMVEAQALVRRLLVVDIATRLSADEALRDPWFQGVRVGCAGLEGVATPISLPPSEYTDPGQTV
jgi:serine/threonine protein kinase